MLIAWWPTSGRTSVHVAVIAGVPDVPTYSVTISTNSRVPPRRPCFVHSRAGRRRTVRHSPAVA